MNEHDISRFRERTVILEGLHLEIYPTRHFPKYFYLVRYRYRSVTRWISL